MMIASVERPPVDWFAISPELSLLAAAGICLLAAVLVPAGGRRATAALIGAGGYVAAFVFAVLLYDRSPDGESIIYAHSDVRPQDPDFVGTGLWLMNSDGSEKHPLQLADGGGDDTEAEYSPDGAQIVFARYRHDADDTRALHIAAADGSDVRRLTPWQHIVEHPRWSPDGRTIIYNIENNDDAPSNKGEGIWTVPASGGKPVLLLASTDELHGFKPDYSPDGSRVVFACAPNHRTTEEICVMNADGTDARQIFDEPGYDNHVVWR